MPNCHWGKGQDSQGLQPSSQELSLVLNAEAQWIKEEGFNDPNQVAKYYTLSKFTSKLGQSVTCLATNDYIV